MNDNKKLFITAVVLIQTTVMFSMQPQEASKELATTIAHIQSTEQEQRAASPTMEYQPSSLVETEQAVAPSPSSMALDSAMSPSSATETHIELIPEWYQQFKVIDRQFLERILNPNPTIRNPAGINDHIVIDLSEFRVLTPLGLATLWGWEDLVDKLCTKGALVNEPMPTNAFANFQGFTPLHIAVILKKTEAAKKLLAHGADINAKVKSTTRYNGLTPLDLATADNYQFDEMTILLTQHGAQRSDTATPESTGSPTEGLDRQNLLLTRYRTQDSSQQKSASYDIKGQTPLINAILTGNISLVQILIAQGSNPDTPIVALEHNKNIFAGFSPLCLASFLGNIPIIETLLQHGANPNYVIKNNTEGWNGFSPIHIAIVRKNQEAIMHLINRRADINKPTTPDKGYRLTPLSLAASMGYDDIIKLLSLRGAPIDHTVDGFTPLHHAILQKQPKSVYALTANGATINAIIDNPSHELHNFNTVCLAVKRSDLNSFTILAYLIQINADLQHKVTSNSKYNGNTPFTLAIISGNIEAVKRLIGAEIDLTKEDPSAALSQFMQYASQNAYSEMQSYIDKANLSLQLFVLGREFNQILARLEKKSDRQSEPGTSADIARTEDILKKLEILLLQQADPNIQGKNGLSPIFAAITPTMIIDESLRERFINLLVAHGAKLDIMTNQGKSLLSLAATYNNAHLVRTLLDAGANPTYGAEKPLEIARAKKYTDIEKILEKAIHDKDKKPSRVSRVFSTLSKTLKR